MRTIINLGKIAYIGQQKRNLVTIELEIKEKECVNFETLEKETMKTFSCSGDIWNAPKTDIVCGGQCLDEIKATPAGKSPTFKKVYDIWAKYHLNDFRAGTKRQCEAVNAWRKESNISGWNYEKECNYLESIGLLSDGDVKWGHQWLCERIPDQVINEIEELIKKHTEN